MTFLKRNRPARRFDERRRGQFQADHRLQFIDGAHARRGPVAVRLIHDEHQVGQPGQIIEIALADVFRKPLDSWETVRRALRS